MLSIVAGLNLASGGGVILAGREVREAGPDRGVVFQAPCLLHWLSALDNVLLGVDELHEVLLAAWRQDKKTALMVTHDVDEALFLSDRVVMMTNGPSAKVGEILHVPFARPRDRAVVMDHPEYYALRERLLGALNPSPSPSSDLVKVQHPGAKGRVNRPALAPANSARAAFSARDDHP